VYFLVTSTWPRFCRGFVRDIFPEKKLLLPLDILLLVPRTCSDWLWTPRFPLLSRFAGYLSYYVSWIALVMYKQYGLAMAMGLCAVFSLPSWEKNCSSIFFFHFTVFLKNFIHFVFGSLSLKWLMWTGYTLYPAFDKPNCFLCFMSAFSWQKTVEM
jgi:hypothetical protein